MKYRIDIDQTLLMTKFDNRKYTVIEPNQKLINIVNYLYDEGHEVIIETGRHWDLFQLTMKQLEEYGIKYHSLLMGKPPSDYIVDDRAFKPLDFIKFFNEEDLK